ncbi:hypothetical protein KCV01_g9057, partial [Aureobasidium melanogenum]
MRIVMDIRMLRHIHQAPGVFDHRVDIPEDDGGARIVTHDADPATETTNLDLLPKPSLELVQHLVPRRMNLIHDDRPGHLVPIDRATAERIAILDQPDDRVDIVSELQTTFGQCRLQGKQKRLIDMHHDLSGEETPHQDASWSPGHPEVPMTGPNTDLATDNI